MINGKRVLGVIPARGGSKGLPRKNVIDLDGKPLIGWTIDSAKGCPYLDRVILSSDDAEIMRIARDLGCDVPFVRPAELARDDSPAIDVFIHALDTLTESYDYLVVLQATTPLRIAQDISACLEICEKEKAPACVTVFEPRHHPYWTFKLDDNQRLEQLMEGEIPYRRQLLPDCYALNGAVYVARTDWLRETRSFLTAETRGHVMPADRSTDIDTWRDLMWIQMLLREKKSEARAA
ncbi:cytidylyltransferase domain-containing protein [Magnetofaba australis]|uniref:Putative acylneuraminate cytidylyltransferase n=1 Tax=Magnetofaba australis IT-1 TaxID=1434232 RepID=A0A1Y2K444_9PROT|nr:acylneuraminate cytidylyltransferase family protein [Magnetofaba australis]OSM01805.1 putative acylneuraminate cytidylyltransferase [Magnetofaba australis IT-1]